MDIRFLCNKQTTFSVILDVNMTLAVFTNVLALSAVKNAHFQISKSFRFQNLDTLWLAISYIF
jgi:hypothetical protein